MTIIFLILIILASVILGFIVLVQNPKGGGLAGSFAGLSNQFMGVKQTTDVLEKGTWIFGGVIGALCIASTFFISAGGTTSSSKVPDAAAPQQQTAQPISTPLPATPTPVK